MSHDILAIETHQLVKRYGRKIALDQLDLRVSTGGCYALLGSNGAGKTTTMRVLANFIRPNHGDARIFGKRCVELRERDFDDIGYVSENQKLPEWMRIGQLIDYLSAIHATWDSDFCTKLLREFDLDRRAKIKSLSRGMKMKVSLLSSIAFRPRLLLLDEPFSGLDPLVRDEFSQGVLELTEQEGWTIFVSSHDIEEVERLADHVGMLDQGWLALSEPTAELQGRFQWVIVSGAELTPDDDLPESWLQVRADERRLEFVHSRWSPDRSPHEIAERTGALPTGIETRGMTLREIFVVLARESKSTPADR